MNLNAINICALCNKHNRSSKRKRSTRRPRSGRALHDRNDAAKLSVNHQVGVVNEHVIHVVLLLIFAIPVVRRS